MRHIARSGVSGYHAARSRVRKYVGPIGLSHGGTDARASERNGSAGGHACRRDHDDVALGGAVDSSFLFHGSLVPVRREAPIDQGGELTRIANNVELGGSAEFRVRQFPLPLRASLSFSQMQQSWSGTMLRFGSLSLDAVAHPLPKVLGTKLYFLGGLGVTTRAPYADIGSRLVPGSPNTFEYFGYKRPRENWAFVEGGAGLELGHAFIQWKLQMPAASEGYVRAPISVGFRF